MITLEYLAGFFDGEGCVNITTRGKSKQVALRVMIVNTDPTILQEIQQVYGGFLSKPRINKRGWKAFRQLTFVGDSAVGLLSTLLPFLRIKKRQAELAIEFWAFQKAPGRNMTKYNESGHAFRVRKPEIISGELYFKAQMHELNKKGLVQ